MAGCEKNSSQSNSSGEMFSCLDDRNGSSLQRSKPHYMIPPHVMDDLASRFVINVTAEERGNVIRLLWQVEQAYWYYLDFLVAENEHFLKRVSMWEFTTAMFSHVPFLRGHRNNLDALFWEWKEYKMSVPTYGAVLMNSALTHVLLVQGFSARGSWGFPKGKVNQDEHPVQCAIREVIEETGYDTTELISHREFVECKIGEQKARLYLVAGIPMDTVFQPKTRCEIKSCAWFELSSLPANKTEFLEMKDALSLNNGNGQKKKPQLPSMFMVMPFVRPIRQWVEKQRTKIPSSIPTQSDTRAYFEAIFTEGASRKKKLIHSQSGAFKEVGKYRMDLSTEVQHCPTGQCSVDFNETNDFVSLTPEVVFGMSPDGSPSWESYQVKKDIRNCLTAAMRGVVDAVLTGRLLATQRSHLRI